MKTTRFRMFLRHYFCPSYKSFCPYSWLFSISPLLFHSKSLNGSVSYKIGSTFLHLPLSEAQSMLESETAKIEADVDKLGVKLSDIREEMQELKVQLYARFGKGINLDV